MDGAIRTRRASRGVAVADCHSRKRRNVHIALTAQLEQLTEESQELPSETRKYYGMFLLLVCCIDRTHTRFMKEIDEVHLPKLQDFEQQARQNIAEAQRLLKRGGPAKELGANMDAGRTTMEACRCFAQLLREQRETVLGENKHIKMMMATAANTYKTVRLSIQVADVMSECQKAFQSLRQLRLPPLRTFQNVRLKREWRQLTERLLDAKP